MLEEGKDFKGTFRQAYRTIKEAISAFEMFKVRGGCNENTFNAITGLVVFIRAFCRMDVAVLKPQMLSVMSGIIS